MTESSRPVWAEIDLQAIRDNLKAVKGLLQPRTALMAVVKANAYGHGLVPVAGAAVEAGAQRLGVALVEEGRKLREAGLTAPIHVLTETPREAASEVVALRLIPTVYSMTALKEFSDAAQARGVSLDINIKVDSGMRRAGASPDEAIELTKAARKLPGLRVEGMLTHFACADEPENDFTAKQLEIFLGLRRELADVPQWHAANSAAALFMPETRLDMVRIGIAMYGLQPSSVPSVVPLRPALSLKAKIAYVRDLAAGEGISYGLTYTAPRPVKVALLPIGYGDGFSRSLSNRGFALVRGERVRIIGNVCMDQLLVELNGPAAAGDEAVLIGRQGRETITAEEMASMLGTINYEVVCRINERVPRRYSHD